MLFIEETSKSWFIFTSGYIYFTFWSVNRTVCLCCRIVYISVKNFIELWIFSDWKLITLWLNLSAAWLLWSRGQFNNIDSTWTWNVKQWLGQSLKLKNKLPYSLKVRHWLGCLYARALCRQLYAQCCLKYLWEYFYTSLSNCFPLPVAFCHNFAHKD